MKSSIAALAASLVIVTPAVAEESGPPADADVSFTVGTNTR